MRLPSLVSAHFQTCTHLPVCHKLSDTRHRSQAKRKMFMLTPNSSSPLPSKPLAAEPGRPGRPARPGGPGGPGGPIGPTAPSLPARPSVPSRPGVPGDPSLPGAPGRPGLP